MGVGGRSNTPRSAYYKLLPTHPQILVETFDLLLTPEPNPEVPEAPAHLMR